MPSDHTSWLSRRHVELAAGMIVAAALTAGALIAGTAHADDGDSNVTIGAAVPNFDAVDTTGARFSLLDYSDATVVLEWLNPGCPYVQKHYETGNMPTLQAEAAAADVIWISINSTHEGHRDFRDAASMAEFAAETGAAPSATVLDPSGEIGRLYGAQTTPHMFVIDHGVLAYAGAIDDRSTTRHSDVEGARNYPREALAAIAAGETITVPQTKSYGCTVKYAS